jgi:uncharacterized protein (TIGR01777 family)
VERIAVTGATGLVGRALVAALVADGHPVVALVRDPDRARDSVPGAAEYLAYQQEEPLAAAPAGCVVNLAGASLFRPFTGRRHLRKVTRQRVLGTRRLAEAGPAVLINASSVGVYGFGAPSDEPVDETTAPLPGPYTEGSLAWEAATAQAPPDTRVVLLRMGYVLSADGGGLPWQLRQARNGKVSYYAPGTQWQAWIHLTDVVAVIRAAIADQRWRGAYNVVAPQPVRARQFAETLARVAGAPPPRPAPALLARLFAGAGIVLGGRRVVPARLTRAGYEFVHTDLEAVLRVAGGW